VLAGSAIRALYLAYDNLNVFEINKRKEDFDKFSKPYGEQQKVPLHYIQVDSNVSRIRNIVKELELELAKDDLKTKVDTVKKLYTQYITSPYQINYSIWARVQRLRMKERLNREAYEIMKEELNTNIRWESSNTGNIFDSIEFSQSCENKFSVVREMLIVDSIFCLDKVLCLIQTAGDSYLFNHSFFAVTYERLADWTAIYETSKKENSMQIDDYLEWFLGKDFRETLSSHYYRERALMHYHQTFDTHNGGRAYLNLLEQMYFIKGDYDDVPCHFNVAIERFLTNNSDKFQDSIEKLKRQGAESTLYDVDNYFEKEEK
jgi:hypothetical protein